MSSRTLALPAFARSRRCANPCSRTHTAAFSLRRCRPAFSEPLFSTIAWQVQNRHPLVQTNYGPHARRRVKVGKDEPSKSCRFHGSRAAKERLRSLAGRWTPHQKNTPQSACVSQVVFARASRSNPRRFTRTARSGIPIDVVVGKSVGALTAHFLRGHSLYEMERIGERPAHRLWPLTPSC